MSRIPAQSTRSRRQSHDFLMRVIAEQLREAIFDGLPFATKCRLAELARSAERILPRCGRYSCGPPQTRIQARARKPRQDVSRSRARAATDVAGTENRRRASQQRTLRSGDSAADTGLPDLGSIKSDQYRHSTSRIAYLASQASFRCD